MAEEAVLDKMIGAGAKRDEERYVPKLWHRIALLTLIYLTVRFLEPLADPAGLFDAVMALAVVYTVIIRLISIRFDMRGWCVLTVDLALVLVMCHLSGGMSSPVKYFGLAYFYLLSPYLMSGALKGFLLAYSVAVTLLILPGLVTGEGVPAAEAARMSTLNLFVLNGAGWPSILLSEYIHKLRKLQRDTSVTFHSLNSSLHLRTQNLQAALDALTQAHEQLKQVDENKTRFLSNVSHELRTPLSSVRSFTEILMNYEDLDRDTENEFLGIIHDEAARLNLLINDILDIVRLEAGKVELHLTRVDMADVARQTVKTLMPMAVEKGLYLRFEEPAGWTPYIKGDRNQMTQVMINLINNAVKFTSTGGITITMDRDADRLVVCVADTGEGIFPEESEDIFKEFFRVADNVGGRPKGTGLGLPISRKILELHGGRIWAEGELGKGSEFKFTVPLDVEELLPPWTSAVFARQPSGRRRRDDNIVLVVEENSTVRQLLRKRLEAAGYKTLGAQNGRAALKLATEWEPGCVISGIQSFSEKDVNLYNGLRAHPMTTEVPVILTCVTIHPEHGLRVGVNGFVQRPMDRYALARAVEGCSQRGRGDVLVISGDRLDARTVQLILGNEGHDVTLSDTSTWMDAALKSAPSIIILDGCVPESTRRETITALRQSKDTMSAAIILVTEAPVGDGKLFTAALGVKQAESVGEDLDPLMNTLRDVRVGGGRVTAVGI